jgi:hypothetical protein
MEVILLLAFLLLILIVPAIRQYGDEMKAQTVRLHIDDQPARRPQRRS